MVWIPAEKPLSVIQPFNAPAVFDFLRDRAIPGVERCVVADDHLGYARTLRLPSGPGAMVVRFVQRTKTAWLVYADLELSHQRDRLAALGFVRRLLDLGHDPRLVAGVLLGNRAMQTLVLAQPGLRVPRCIDSDELVVRAIIGQQVSVRAATTHLTRLVQACGTPHSSRDPALDRLFPTAAQVAATVRAPADDEPLDPDRPLRLPRRNLRTVACTAAALAAGDLVVDIRCDPADLSAALIARPGIGPWAAPYLRMRVCGDPDVWLPGDVALVAGAKAAGILPADLPKTAAHRELARLAHQWSPWRSYAAMHLWRVAGLHAQGLPFSFW